MAFYFFPLLFVGIFQFSLLFFGLIIDGLQIGYLLLQCLVSLILRLYLLGHQIDLSLKALAQFLVELSRLKELGHHSCLLHIPTETCISVSYLDLRFQTLRKTRKAPRYQSHQ